ncbi:MAG: hypothetical protein ACE5I1_27685 [bacterium]
MKFSDPRLFIFKDDILKVAEKYRLNTEELLVETFVPRNNAIFVEGVEGNRFRVHINLQENRIVSAKQLNAHQFDKTKFAKYIDYMK